MSKFSLNFLRTKGGEYFRFGENPSRDWLYTLCFFVVIALLAVGFSAFVFIKVNEGDFFGTATERDRSVEAIDRTRLERVYTTLKERAKNFEAGRDFPGVFDPSL